MHSKYTKDTPEFKDKAEVSSPITKESICE